MATELGRSIGRRLRDLRADAGLSQAEVGLEVGLPRTAVTQIEAGKRGLSAEEVVRFSSVLRRSPAAILGAADPGAMERDAPDAEQVLEELLAAEPAFSAEPKLEEELRKVVTLCRFLTRLEAEVGLDVHGAGVITRSGAQPRTAWEAAHQGFVAAQEERRRLDLGSAPIRSVSETLATLRVRTAKLSLPEGIGGISLQTEDAGPLIVVDLAATPEERRFRYAHGLAHAIFDRSDGWVICHRGEQDRLKEVRANAFASGLLLPRGGVERYLQSMGRDTMGASLGCVVEISSEAPTDRLEGDTVLVSGRARRGAWELNHFELAQLADYFGVSEALVAHTLKNQRLLSTDTRDQLVTLEGQESGRQARRAMRLGTSRPARGRDAFVSRLIALAVEMRRRGALSSEQLELILPLLEMEEEERRLHFGGPPATASAAAT